MLKALARLPGHLLIVAPDIFTPVSDGIRYAGKAADGVYVTRANPPNGALPPAGQHWLRRFADTQLGGQVQTSSVLAAAATEVLLKAIERSDGTRASVVAALRRTDMQSVIGRIKFTNRGDIGACSISVFRIVGGISFVPDVQADLQGARFVRSIPCDVLPGGG